MKKAILIFSIILVLFSVVLNVFITGSSKQTNKNFSINDYDYFIENFEGNVCVGEIKNADIAIEKAETIFLEKYVRTVDKYRPYEAYYDKKNNCWLVKGTLKKKLFTNVKGGTPAVIFDAAGNILALWHGK